MYNSVFHRTISLDFFPFVMAVAIPVFAEGEKVDTEAEKTVEEETTLLQKPRHNPLKPANRL